MKKKRYKGRDIYELSNEECEMMFSEEDKAIVNAYVQKPSQRFAVSVMTKKGNIYTGASYVSDTLTLTLHSEASALAHAANHGETDIVAITGPNCHICKQLIWESSLRSGIEVVVVIKENGRVKQIPISELMLYPWPERKKKE